MVTLDNGTSSAAITTINQSFDISDQMESWGITIYILEMAITISIAGKLEGMYAHIKVFIVEVIIFCLGSLYYSLLFLKVTLNND